MKKDAIRKYSALVWYSILGALAAGLVSIDYLVNLDLAGITEAYTKFVAAFAPVYIVGGLLVWFVTELMAALTAGRR